MLVDVFSFGLADAYKVVSLSASGLEAHAEHENGVISVKLHRPQKRVSLGFELEATPGNSQDENGPSSMIKACSYSGRIDGIRSISISGQRYGPQFVGPWISR